MKNLSFLGVTILILSEFLTACKPNENVKKPVVSFAEKQTEKKIEVLVDGQQFTVFQWPDNICKPVFYPVCASSGTEITRGFPINPRNGERADHPHQIGLWFTYGNVNGNDFWGNGSQGLGTKNSNGGTIKHLRIENIKKGTGEGSFDSFESWVDSTGNELLKEKTSYSFIADGKIRIIDRNTILTAGEKNVEMPDTKEGMFGIRVARQLELPSSGMVELYNTDGSVTAINDTLNTGISGNYESSEGIFGENVWGTRARWMKLDGKIGDENISVIICDHPGNPNYPTYWHARGYGLFSANPLGVRDFTKGTDSLNFVISAGNSVTFKYRVIVASGVQLLTQQINDLATEFASGEK
ncbi:MAG TPA: PmoA family protein [Draconibacterium sp.]|nr:PmoA family protein [Draconibacterium sp.]